MAEYINELGRLVPAPSAVKKNKRIGRGRGSGHGDTATRGDKGQQSRSGYNVRPGFEGGQMPLKRRVPKRGFRPLNKAEYNEVKVGDLRRIEGEIVNPETMRKTGLVKARGPVVLLGVGEVERALKVSVHRITESAKAKITAAGGSIEVLELEPIDRPVKKGPAKKAKKQ